MKKNHFKEVLRKFVLRILFKELVVLLSLCFSSYLIRVERHLSIEKTNTTLKVEYHSIRDTTKK